MATQEKVTISLPKDLVNTLEQTLIKAYKDAYSEIKTENQEFEGTINDGIS
jgi:DNA-binding protein YbaB